MPREYAGGAKRTQLVGDITAASTTFTVADATSWPTGAVGPFAIALNLGRAGEEKVLVQSRSGNTLTVATGGRGYDGTTAATHQSGADVDHVLTAIDIREATSVTTAEGTAFNSARLGGISAPLYLLTSDANAAYATKAENGFQPIAEVVLGAAGSISFGSVPATYRHLRVVLAARATDGAATTNGVIVRINSDTGANYDWQTLHSQATSVIGNEALAATSITAGVVPAGLAPAGLRGSMTIDIPDYARTTFEKSLLANSSAKWGTAGSNMQSRQVAGFWRSTAAIGALFLGDSAGLGFAAGSIATLYGSKGV